MSCIRVREARSTDLDEVEEVLRESFSGSQLRWAIQDLWWTDVLVAEVEGRIVGVVEIYVRYVEGYGLVGVIYYLAVRRRFRRRGVGRALVEAAESVFREVGCRFAAASSSSDNKASLRFFEKLGYSAYPRGHEVYRSLVRYLYAFEDDVVLLKEL